MSRPRHVGSLIQCWTSGLPDIPKPAPDEQDRLPAFRYSRKSVYSLLPGDQLEFLKDFVECLR
jgi:hypothetical protein